MADLVYTDGSNGNGITDCAELLRYLTDNPLAFTDHKFIDSYAPLLKSSTDETTLLGIFDTSTSKFLKFPPGFGPEQKKAWIRHLRSRLSAIMRSSVPSFEEACSDCIEKVKSGQQLDPVCRALVMVRINSDKGFTVDNSHFVCCGIAQLLANFKGSKQRQTEIERFSGFEPGGCCAFTSCRKPHPPLQCSRCLCARYCDATCQKSHWKIHKTICKND